MAKAVGRTPGDKLVIAFAKFHPCTVNSGVCKSAVVLSASTMTLCSLYNLSSSFNMTLITICCISGVLAFVENAFVLLSVRKIHSLRATARYFMTSLAAAELLSGVTGNAFFSSWLILNLLRHGTSDVLWKTETVVWIFTTVSVTYNLVNVALDRYIAITLPLQYHTRMDLTRCVLLIAFAWILAFSSSFPVYLVPEKHLPYVWISGSVFAVLIPFCVIAVCYFKIYRATKSTFRLRQNITDAQQIAENKRQRKTACTFAIITGLFIVLFTPSFIINSMQLFNTEIYELNEQNLCGARSVRKVWICIAVVSYFSAVFDPWIYVIRMPDFRFALKVLLQSLCQVFSKCRFKNKVWAKNRVGGGLQEIESGISRVDIFDPAL